MTQVRQYRAHARTVLSLGLPLIGSHMAQFGLQVTDTVMLGWYGVEALAAGVLGATIFFTLFILGSGFAHAVMPMVATAAARGDSIEVRRATRMGLWLSAAFGVGVMPLMWWSGPLLLWLGQPPGVAELGQDYLRIAGLGMVPTLIVMVLKNHLAALGRTQVVLWGTVAAVFVNAGLNWAFIFGNWGFAEMGVRGAALASVIVQLVSALALLGYAALLPALRHYALLTRLWRPDWSAMGQVFRVGWPIGLALLAESGLFAATSLMMGWIGTRELAAHGIAIEIMAMIFMIHMGLSNAATVVVGRAAGRNDPAALRAGALTSVILSGGIAVLAVIFLLALPEFLVGLFLSPDDPERPAIIALGAGLLMIAALFQLADALQVMAMGLLRGVQDTRVPMVIASVSYWLVGIPISYLLGFRLGLGATGIWLGLVVGLSLAAAMLMWRFWRGAGRSRDSMGPQPDPHAAG